MTIDVVTIVRDESEILPYFLRHYATFADTIHIFDDGSTDATVDIARTCPVAVVQPYPTSVIGTYGELERQAFLDDFYRQSTADWMCIVDADELVYHRQMRHALTTAPGPVITCVGWNMVADALPDTDGQLYERVTTGVRARAYDKPIIVQTGHDLRWKPGRHGLVEPRLRLRHGMALLHYRFLGKDYTIERTRRYLDAVTRYLTATDESHRIPSAARYAATLHRMARNYEAMCHVAAPLRVLGT